MRESHYSRRLGTSAEAIGELMTMLIEAPHGLILVSGSDEITGMIGVVATRHPVSGEPVMSELFWYVAPKARGRGARLLIEAERWARANGIAKSLVASPSREVSSLYRRLGYQRLEVQFIKDL